jgi:hypothetical protein
MHTFVRADRTAATMTTSLSFLARRIDLALADWAIVVLGEETCERCKRCVSGLYP